MADPKKKIDLTNLPKYNILNDPNFVEVPNTNKLPKYMDGDALVSAVDEHRTVSTEKNKKQNFYHLTNLEIFKKLKDL